MSDSTKAILTIAGSDSYGGAGIQIDIKTASELGVYAFSAITAITSQNSTGVKSVYQTPVAVLRSQIEATLHDVNIDSVKIGMLSNSENISVVVELLSKYKIKNIILDPIIMSSSGRELLDSKAIEIMKRELFPIVTLLTPNIPEFDYLSDSTEITTKNQPQILRDMHLDALLLKGGHDESYTESVDRLYGVNGDYQEFTANKVTTSHTHGTGCILSTAIATYLAKGYSLVESISLAKEFLTMKLERSELKFNYKESKTMRNESIF